MNEKDIIFLIQNDAWMMDILRCVRELNLPDWWIGAGFVRSKVWDHLQRYTERTPIPDIDVIYFDKHDFSSEEEKEYSTRKENHYQNILKKQLSGLDWSVTNQARMHTLHNDLPYKNSSEGLSNWIETATCIGVRLEKDEKLVLTTPHGIDDLVNLIVRPTKQTDTNIQEFKRRMKKKNWPAKWPKLKIVI